MGGNTETPENSTETTSEEPSNKKAAPSFMNRGPGKRKCYRPSKPTFQLNRYLKASSSRSGDDLVGDDLEDSENDNNFETDQDDNSSGEESSAEEKEEESENVEEELGGEMQ